MAIVRKPLDLPPKVARAFLRDTAAFRIEENAVRRDEIALRQLRALRQHQSDKKLGLGDVKEMFRRVKGEV